MSSEATTKTVSSIPHRVPCALVRLWPADRAEQLQQLLAPLLQKPGVYSVESCYVAIVPTWDDPSASDTALEAAGEVLDSMLGRFLPGDYLDDPEAPALLISSSELLLEGSYAQLLPDPLLADMEAKAPIFRGAGIYLTSRTLHDLDEEWEVEVYEDYIGPSGKRVPLLRANAPVSGNPPWRNPRVLHRQTQAVDRPDASAALRERLDDPVVSLLGSLGCGKSRLAHQVLEQSNRPFVWTRCRGSRRATAPVAEQFLLKLLTGIGTEASDARLELGDHLSRDDIDSLLDEWRASDTEDQSWAVVEWVGLASRLIQSKDNQPVYWIVDDFQFATSADRKFVELFSKSPHVGTRLRLWVIERGHATASLDVEPTIVPSMSEQEAEELAQNLFSGQAIPPIVLARFVEASAGHPLALEEGLLQLPRSKVLRQIYGNFFFSGTADTLYQPSSRLVMHVFGEVQRVLEANSATVLALAASPVPPAELASAGLDLGFKLERRWEERGVDAGLLQWVESPWGSGVCFTVPAYAEALVSSSSSASHHQILRPLGRLLANLSHSGEAQWRAYGLLRNEPEAVDALLNVLKSTYVSQLPRPQVIDAIQSELETLRSYSSDDDAKELQLTWHLVHLARRIGKLEAYVDELTRALELAQSSPRRLLALASLKAELDQSAGRFEVAEQTIRRALEAAKGTNERRQAVLLAQLGKMLLRQERYEEARELFHNLLEALEAANSTAMAAGCRYYLGNIAIRQKRFTEARELHEMALAERQRQNLVLPIGSSLSALGSISLAIGNYPEALSFYRRAGETLGEYGKDGEVSFALLGIGRALTRLGDFTAASKPFREALHVREGRDDVAGEAIARLAVAENYLHLGHPERALSEARKAHFSLSMLSISWLLADAEQLLGRILLFQRKFESAHRHLENALALHLEKDDKLSVSRNRAALLDIAMQLDNVSEARQQLERLMALLEQLEEPEQGEQLHFEVAKALAWLRERGQVSGQPEKHLRRAYELLLRQASHLDPAQRHQFLFGIEANRQILLGAGNIQRGESSA